MKARTTPPATAATTARPLLLSLRPRFAEAILDGVKTIELRRTRVSAPPGTKLVLYASAPTMAVVGVATLLDVQTSTPGQIWRRHRRHVCVSKAEYDDYFAGADLATAISISAPERLAAPHTLAALRAATGFRPPQSYRYLSELDPEVLHEAAADSLYPRNACKL
ncbi:hypothetical protein DMC63_06250 [Streptomyces sp. WAC 05977]|nr:hypothetical protein DMC63_06250 [Streptomyces sp. WAC 05977]